MMGKVYKRRVSKGRDKYSVEQTLVNGTVGSATTSYVSVVPPVDFQGMRKVKHLTCTISPQSSATAGFVWALFYLPAGMTPPGFSSAAGSPLVEPNQYVMNAGIFSSGSGPIRVSSPVSRNLNSGDQVILMLRATTGSDTAYTALVRYAITLQ